MNRRPVPVDLAAELGLVVWMVFTIAVALYVGGTLAGLL